jgi:CheY-like chemotaxis protein
MNDHAKKILVVDDEAKILEVVKAFLENGGRIQIDILKLLILQASALRTMALVFLKLSFPLYLSDFIARINPEIEIPAGQG